MLLGLGAGLTGDRRILDAMPSAQRAAAFQKRGYPSLALEGSFQVGPPTGQLQTRIHAFIEMLSR